MIRAACAFGKLYRAHRRHLPGDCQLAIRDLLTTFAAHLSPSERFSTSRSIRIARGDLSDQLSLLGRLASRSSMSGRVLREAATCTEDEEKTFMDSFPETEDMVSPTDLHTAADQHGQQPAPVPVEILSAALPAMAEEPPSALLRRIIALEDADEHLIHLLTTSHKHLFDQVIELIKEYDQRVHGKFRGLSERIHDLRRDTLDACESLHAMMPETKEDKDKNKKEKKKEKKKKAKAKKKEADAAEHYE